ncbi:MFS transporter [Novosphingobium sp.]|uniref:MFS transporter n=1 Tax=Novosphingobium sp. TaxID=1874826 RepID=UPI0031E04271
MTSRPSETPSEIGVALILAACFGTVMLDRMEQLFLGPDLERGLHLSPSQIGLLAGAVSVCWALSTFVFGMVSDRVGRKRVLVPAMVVFSLLSWVSGLARNFEEMLLIRALLGLAEGPCWSVIMATMEDLSTPERRGRNVGIVVCAGSLVGSTIGPVFATQIAAHFGWQTAFFAAGIPGLILAIVVARQVPEPSRKPHTARASLAAARAVLASRDLWLCFLAALMLTVWIFAFNTFAPLFMSQTKGFSGTQIGWILGASGLGGFLYCLTWPALSDRIGRRPALLTAAAIATVLPLGFLLPGLDARLLAPVAMLTSAGPAIAALAMVLVPMELAPSGQTATAVGFVSIGGDALGATLGPVLGGYLVERFDLTAPLWLAAGAGAAIILACLFLSETRPRLHTRSV